MLVVGCVFENRYMQSSRQRLLKKRNIELHKWSGNKTFNIHVNAGDTVMYKGCPYSLLL